MAIPDTMTKKERNERPVVRIVIYDNVVGYLNWVHADFRSEAAFMCNTRCVVTDNRHEVGSADVVMFHAPTHGKKHPVYPPSRPKDSIYGLFSMEQPKYAPILSDLPKLQKTFDFMVTYNLDTLFPDPSSPTNELTKLPNIPVTYFPLHKMPVEWIVRPPRPYAEKTGYGTGVNVAVFTSNCKNAGAAGRLQYLEALMKEIPIHSYGGCLHNRDEPVGSIEYDPLWPDYDQKRSRKMVILSHYKFYLAFENLQIHDYVSEKVFEGLFSGAVPVYRGASRIGLVMPTPHSFVDANNLSPKELAKLLTELSAPENQDRYEKFLDYKQKPAPGASGFTYPSLHTVKGATTGAADKDTLKSTSARQIGLSSQFIDVAYMSYVHPMVACRICDYALNLKQQKGGRH